MDLVSALVAVVVVILLDLLVAEVLGAWDRLLVRRGWSRAAVDAQNYAIGAVLLIAFVAFFAWM